jgi:hypothetical protein
MFGVEQEGKKEEEVMGKSINLDNEFIDSTIPTVDMS